MKSIVLAVLLSLMAITSVSSNNDVSCIHQVYPHSHIHYVSGPDGSGGFIFYRVVLRNGKSINITSVSDSDLKYRYRCVLNAYERRWDIIRQ